MARVLLLEEDMTAVKMTLTNCPATDYAHATLGQLLTPAPYCRMGEDYDCTCRYCSSASAARYAAEVAAYNAATADHRAEVARVAGALLALGAIGQAVRAALSPGHGIAHMLRDVVPLLNSTHGSLKGAFFQITGKIGNAKLHTGKTGVCRWIGEGASFAPVPRYRGGWRQDRTTPTIRVGLEIAGEPKLVYVAFSQLDRLPTPEDVSHARTIAAIVKKAIAPLRPKFDVVLTKRGKPRKGQIAYIVEGRDAGASGEVFWIGADKRSGEANTRLGIKTADGQTIWASAYDCAAEPMRTVDRTERALLERVAADAVEEGRLDDAREILGQLRARKA